jgi:hypothetical protein
VVFFPEKNVKVLKTSGRRGPERDVVKPVKPTAEQLTWSVLGDCWNEVKKSCRREEVGTGKKGMGPPLSNGCPCTMIGWATCQHCDRLVNVLVASRFD